MKSKEEVIFSAAQTLEIEAKSLLQLKDKMGDEVFKAVDLIIHSKGRVVVTGIGKSAIVAQKIVATLNSTGTPSIFMHAADAIHGDLGIIQKDDVVVCLSNSGNTAEIRVLIPLVKAFGNKLIAFTGNKESLLGKEADIIIDTSVEREACPNNLAPTSSTIAQMAMGDVLAVCLLDSKDFTSTDFAKYHPGGALGKKLYLRVGTIAAQNEKPQVSYTDSLQKVILEISEKRLGATVVIEGGKLVGLITDGDLRRMLSKVKDLNTVTAGDIMTKSPKTISEDTLAVEAMAVMEKHNISQLIVMDNDEYKGFIHLHDLIREGIIKH